MSAARPPAQSRNLRRLLGFLVMVFVLGGLSTLFMQRNTWRLTLAAGESQIIRVEIPMKRFTETGRFAKESGLPVKCRIIKTPDSRNAMRMAIIETGHTVHKMWARVHVIIPKSTLPGSYSQKIAFTIDGEGDWPEATIKVRVPRP